MKIPSVLPITAEQSRAARFQLGLTQANVIEQGKLAGHKLKNFETGRYVPDMGFLQVLREFYQERGIEFSELEAKKTETSKKVHGVGVVVPMQASRFVVDPALTHEQADSILERMDTNDVQIASLMSKSIQSGSFAKYSKETDADTRMIFGLMAENYLLFRTIQGRNILSPLPEKTEPKTQAELIGSLYSTSLLGSMKPAEAITDTEVTA